MLDSLAGNIYAIIKLLVHNGNKAASFWYHDTRRSKLIPLLLLFKPDPLRWAPIWFWVQTWRLHLFWHHSPRRSKVRFAPAFFCKKCYPLRSLAPPFQTATADAGLRFGLGRKPGGCIFFGTTGHCRQNLRLTIVIRRFCYFLFRFHQNKEPNLSIITYWQIPASRFEGS